MVYFIVCVVTVLVFFCFLPSCLPAGPVGALSPLERTSYFQGATPASPLVSWVRSAQTRSSASIYSETLRPGSQKGFGGNLERWSRDYSCPPSQQTKRLWGVGPSGCRESRGHPVQLSLAFHPGHPWPESHRSPRLHPGSLSQRRGSLCLPLCHCLKGQEKNSYEFHELSKN